MKAYKKLQMSKDDKLYSAEVILTMNERAVIINALRNYATDNAEEQKALANTLANLHDENDFFNDYQA